jgi:hypothetical protein
LISQNMMRQAADEDDASPLPMICAFSWFQGWLP